MSTSRNAPYPHHLAKLVSQRLAEMNVAAPPEKVLLRLFETLYFASLKTDEARPCRCTVNYMDPAAETADVAAENRDNDWTAIRFRKPQPLDVRSLLKLADAADPTVSSLAVFSDPQGELFIWGMVDQELHYGDYVSLDTTNSQRPGLFQAAISGVGCVSVSRNFALLGSLEQNSLVSEHHDVLWEGPVHERLKEQLQTTLHDRQAAGDGDAATEFVAQVTDDLLVRWQNAICRILFNVQQYGHGGGLLIVPNYPTRKVDVKYEQMYDRLPKALFRLAQHQILKRQTADTVAEHCPTLGDMLPCHIYFDAVRHQKELDRLKNELLGCVRFIASLSRVDGFVILDKSLVVHGFGVEARAEADVTDVYIAGDALATQRLLRRVPVSQFGTRHRAMMRYCSENDGAMGFVISQDGDIRATMKYRNRLVVWEKVNVQLAYRAENRGGLISNFSPKTMTSLFHCWIHSVAQLHTA